MIYSLIVILLVLVLDRALPDRGGLDPFSWFKDWIDSVEQRFNGGEARHGLAALLLTLGTVFLVVLLIQVILAQMGWAFRLGFDVLLMYFFVQASSKLIAARKVGAALIEDDSEQAEAALADLPPAVDEPVADANASWLASVRLLSGTNNWLVAPVFWFLLFGPAGAALYYLSGIVARSWHWQNARFQEFGRPALGLYQGLSWLPVRILAVGYALLGDFENAFASWKLRQDTWTGSNDQLLVTIGLGALGESEESRHPEPDLVDRAVALEYRVFIFWVFIGSLVALTSFLA